MPSSVSVVIPSLSDNVERTRASLARQTVQPVEIVVISGVRPAARARNLGVARSSGELILFVDDDAELGNEFVLERMREAMAEPDVAVVGSSKILPPTSTALQRRIANEVPRWVYPILAASIETNPPLDRYGFSAVTTTCCLIRREVFEQVGGFDERMTTGEDPELLHRIRRAGYSLVIAAGTWTYHAPPSDLRRFLVKSFNYGVGHALEARLDPGRRMAVLPPRLSPLVILLAPMLFVFNLFADLRFEPTFQMRPAFRPVQALSRLATLLGYLRGSTTNRA